MPAEKAGLQKGDLIMTVNGQPIHSMSSSTMIRTIRAASRWTWSTQRDGKQLSVTVQPVFSEPKARGAG